MAERTLWDVVVIGGGPAGMMAAGTAARNGASVILIEKNETLGKKLLITGGGRCNVTNSEFDTRKLLAKFKENGKFLFSAFSQWGVKETLDFFHASGMDTKVENELRAFPVSNSARSVWEVLVRQLKKYNVTVLSNAPVVEIVRGRIGEPRAGQGRDDAPAIVGIKLKNKTIVCGRSIIIATGGISRPETGSTGDGYVWLKKIAHTVIEPRPSLVPLVIKEKWIKKLAGISLGDVKIALYQNNERQAISAARGKSSFAVAGKILFTHVGVSGPIILNMSKDIGELLKYGEVVLSLDILPKQDNAVLNANLQTIFKTHDKKKIRNALPDIIPSALALVVLELSGIDPEKSCNGVTREERMKLVATIKGFRMRVDKLLGVEKAVITSGGVALEEVDFKTMRSRLFPNLYLIGDILNIDRPSGGYSLQLCWTTGFVAGKVAAVR